MWGLRTYDELLAAQDAIVASQTPEDSTESLEMMMPALNLDEVAKLLGVAQKNAVPQAFQNARTLAQRILSAEEWMAVKTLPGIAEMSYGRVCRAC